MYKHLMTTYKPLAVNLTRGDGIYVWDNDGNPYLDALCGISVTSLGHNHPQVTRAIQEQSSRILHTSNLYHIENQSRLADLLCEVSGMEQVFFGNSGAEANEAAIKLARLYGRNKGMKGGLFVEGFYISEIELGCFGHGARFPGVAAVRGS